MRNTTFTSLFFLLPLIVCNSVVYGRKQDAASRLRAKFTGNKKQKARFNYQFTSPTSLRSTLSQQKVSFSPSTYSAPYSQASQVTSVTSAQVPRRGLQNRNLNNAIASGILLAFNSGFINGCCLSGGLNSGRTSQAVAAVTGAYTTSALGVASGNMKQVATQLSILASYISGSAIWGLMSPNQVAYSQSPLQGLGYFVGATVLFYASMLAYVRDSPPLASFCLAAVANGIQNSMSSTYSNNLCRTTHFTGISSDIGTYLGQVMRGNSKNLFRLKVYLALAISFWVGGYVSFFATKRYAGGSLMLSAALYVILGTGLSRRWFLRLLGY
jgi:uncharacterized membrane protein YoaK (UPF0700 family)